jgi:DNA-binding transcriptional regulator YdaS (Cro superfamily)
MGKAAKALARWQAAGPRRQRGQSAIARALGVSQPAVSAWLKGVSRPEGYLRREALEELTGGAVKAADWTTPEERRQGKVLLARLAGEPSSEHNPPPVTRRPAKTRPRNDVAA